ncbi:MAG: hypothetical protein AAGC72_02560 [Planctomycetota bacterium]
MKVRVYESDGVFQGGLLKLKVFNAMSCRMWHARPDPNLRESVIDISGFDEPTSRHSWFRLLLPKREPDGPWPPLEDEEFDGDAQAYRISPEEAKLWFEAQGFIPPDDLTRMCVSEEQAARSLEPDSSEPFMPASWFDDEYGIHSERLRSAFRSGRVRSKKSGSRLLYSVPDAIRCWPEECIQMPANSG